MYDYCVTWLNNIGWPNDSNHKTEVNFVSLKNDIHLQFFFINEVI